MLKITNVCRIYSDKFFLIARKKIVTSMTAKQKKILEG